MTVEAARTAGLDGDKDMTQGSVGSASIDVTVAHSPLAFFCDLFTPTVTINGQRYPRPWGKHSFEVPSGMCEVSVSYPWVFAPECGKSTVRLMLRPGEMKKITYRAGLIRYLPGRMVVVCVNPAVGLGE